MRELSNNQKALIEQQLDEILKGSVTTFEFHPDYCNVSIAKVKLKEYIFKLLTDKKNGN